MSSSTDKIITVQVQPLSKSTRTDIPLVDTTASAPTLMPMPQPFLRPFLEPLYLIPFIGTPNTTVLDYIIGITFFTYNIVIAVVNLVQFCLATSLSHQQDAARQVSYTGAADLIFLLVPVTQHSPLLYAIGLPFERAIRYHTWIGATTISMFVLHGVLNCVGYARNQSMDVSYVHQVFDEVLGNDSGFISWVTLILLGLTSIRYVRRRLWQLFIRSHIILFFIFIFFGTAHARIIYYLIPGLLLWIIDWILRYRNISRRATVVNLETLQSGDVRVQIAKNNNLVSMGTHDKQSVSKNNFSYEAGQYILVCIPAIDPTQWHPFSISSSPYEEDLFIHCRVKGDWTRLLKQLANECEKSGERGLLPSIFVDGPYGSLSWPIETYRHIVFVAGGMGVTPVQSIVNELLHRHSIGQQDHSTLNKLSFHWAVNDPILIVSVKSKLTQQIIDGTGPLPSFLDLNIYISSKPTIQSDSGDTSNGLALMSNDPSMMTFSPYIREHRMHAATIVSDMKNAVLNDSIATSASGRKLDQIRVLVIVCGPLSMVTEVHTASLAMSDRDVRFDFHEETFEF